MRKIYKTLLVSLLLTMLTIGTVSSTSADGGDLQDYTCVDMENAKSPPSEPPANVNINELNKISKTPLCESGKVPLSTLGDKLNIKDKKGKPIKGFPDDTKYPNSISNSIEYADCSSGSTCYDWANSNQVVSNRGVFAYLTENNPNVASNSYHSIAEIGVVNSTGLSWPGNMVEVGWRKVYNDNTRLFVFWWKNGAGQCYNNYCSGWVQYSNKYYPGMVLNTDTFHPGGVAYAIQYRYGDWWVWYNDEWIGYYPGSLWNGKFFKGEQAQYYGEVASQVSTTITDMGNGLWASDNMAAKMTYQQYYSDSNVWANANTYKMATSPNLYTIEPLCEFYCYPGYPGIRFGGPGNDGFSSLDLITPNGGENWKRGTTQTIQWLYEGYVGNVKIELFKGGVLDKVIDPSTSVGSAGQRLYSWTISSTQTLGNDYKVKVTGIANPIMYYDISENNFIISMPATLTVISPNGGENWGRGTTKTITWSSSGSVGPYVKLELLKAGVLNRVITSGTPNDGSFSWFIPSIQTLGSDYKIRITSTSNPAYSDKSDNNFVISSGNSITIVSPNGGENWIRGTNKEIKWTKTGSTGGYVKIELFKGGVLNKVITLGTPNDGSYYWYVPTTQTIASDYKIKVTSTSNSAYYDFSNSNFIISAGSITVTSPNGGESWAKGSTHTITWSKTGSTGSYVKIELLKGGILNKVISSSTTNDGSFSWTVPSTQTYGTDYKIRITSISNSIYKDSSNNNFNIY